MKSSYIYLTGILICFLYSCSIELGMCRFEDHPAIYSCVPVPAYKGWNKCVDNCENIQLQSKTKPYKAKEWIRPRPYAYP